MAIRMCVVWGHRAVNLALGCWILLAGITVSVAVVLTWKRSRSWVAVARRLGFQYQASATPFAATDIRGLTVLDGDDLTTVTNVLQGSHHNFPFIIFDLPVCNASTEMMMMSTAAAFRCHRRMPMLQIATKSVLDRLGEALTHKPCLELDHDFAKHFIVSCTDQRQTRDFLTPQRVQHLSLHANHFRIESSPDWLLIYQPGVTVKPSGLADFIEKTTLIASGLLPTEPVPLPISA